MTMVKRAHPVKARGRRHMDFSTPLLLAPYAALFLFFIALPVFVAFLLSFTYFNAVELPQINGLSNYIEIVTQDDIFMRYVLPNTLIFSVIVGPVGYVLQFLLAWLLTQIPKAYRTVFALIFYSPSMTTGITMSVMWKVIFSGDQYGYLNNLLMSAGILEAPVNWLADANCIMPIMILVSLWGSMGVGFLAMMSGILNTDPQLYEAGYIDGVSNRFQEIVYITIPSMKPQMLFGAVMACQHLLRRADRRGPDRAPIPPPAMPADHDQSHQRPRVHSIQHGIRRRPVGGAPAADPGHIPDRQPAVFGKGGRMMRFQGQKLNPTRLSRSQIKIFAVLIPLAVVMALPIVYIFVTAFKPLDELFAFPPKFLCASPPPRISATS